MKCICDERVTKSVAKRFTARMGCGQNGSERLDLSSPTGLRCPRSRVLPNTLPTRDASSRAILSRKFGLVICETVH
jgi:hypothetical protein